MVRLKDIAAQAGISIMTVSKAMGEATDVSPQTRARVRLLAQQMGYVPNSMAQGLRNRKTRLLGLVLSTVANPIFARTISAIEQGAFEWGYELILTHTLNDLEREEACIRRLLARRVEGMFVFPIYRLAPTSEIYNILQLRQTPTVVLGHSAPFCSAFHNVECEDLNGSYQMTRHLLEIGHRSIAFFGGPTGAPWAVDRLEGYRRALRDHQIEPDDRLIFTAGAGMEDGEKTALQMLNESVSVTAVQAVNDLVAMGAANVFLNQGLKIPADLSVCGFGNLLMSEHFRVPLTTMRQPKLRLGVAAMEMMQKLLRNERVESRRITADLIARASTAPPRTQP